MSSFFVPEPRKIEAKGVRKMRANRKSQEIPKIAICILVNT